MQKEGTDSLLEAIRKAGMVAPGDALVVGEAAGALCLEIEQALGEGIFVVKFSSSGGGGGGREHDPYKG